MEGINKHLDKDKELELRIISLENSAETITNKLLGKKQLSPDSLNLSVRSWDKATDVYVAVMGFRLLKDFKHIFTLIKHPYKQVTDIFLNDKISPEDVQLIKKIYINKINPPKWISLLNEDKQIMSLNFQLYFEEGYEFIEKTAVDYILSTHRPVLVTVTETAHLFEIYKIEPERVVYVTQDQIQKRDFYKNPIENLDSVQYNNAKQAISSIEARILKLKQSYGDVINTLPEYQRLGNYFK